MIIVYSGQPIDHRDIWWSYMHHMHQVKLKPMVISNSYAIVLLFA